MILFLPRVGCVKGNLDSNSNLLSKTGEAMLAMSDTRRTPDQRPYRWDTQEKDVNNEEEDTWDLDQHGSAVIRDAESVIRIKVTFYLG